MKMQRLISTCLIFIWLIFPCAALAQEDILMLFATYPPFYWGSDEEFSTVENGMLIEFLTAFESQYPQYKITKMKVNRTRADIWMDTGKAQAFSLSNPMFTDHPGDYLFTIPLWHTKDLVISRKDDPLFYLEPEDLFGKHIGIIRGNSYGSFDELIAEGKFEVTLADSNKQLYKLLELGRVDAIFGNLHATPYLMRLNGFDPANFHFSRKSLLQFGLMIEVNKEYQELVNKLNKFIIESRANGLMTSIEAPYLK